MLKKQNYSQLHIKMIVTVFSIKEFEKPYIKKASTKQHNLQLTHKSLDKKTAELASDGKSIIVFTTDDISPPIIDKLNETGVEYTTSLSAGPNHIDIENGKEAGFKLTNATGYSPHAVAEHSVGTMLCINRNMIQASRNMLKHGMIGSSGLDVYEYEKDLFFYDHKDEAPEDDQFAYLPANPNVLITGHQAFTTEEVFDDMNNFIFEAINKCEAGEEPEKELG